MAAETNDELVKIAQVARAVALAVAQNEEAEPGQAGVSLDVEATLQGLMFFAAAIIGQNTNLKTPRDFRLEAERIGDVLKRYVAADRKAAEVGGERLLNIVGAGMVPEAASNARN